MMQWWGKVAVLPALLFCMSCSHQVAQSPQNGAQLSFGHGSSPLGPSPTANLLVHRVPSGTAVLVRLREPLSSASARSGDPFRAVLQEPLRLEGGQVLAAGSDLTGRILEAASAERLKAAGYLRLTLVQLNVAGKQVPLKTSSIFLKATGMSPADVEVSPRRILALRLTEAAGFSD